MEWTTLEKYEQHKICQAESLSNKKAGIISSAKNALFLHFLPVVCL
jgi:hypothetical protein